MEKKERTHPNWESGQLWASDKHRNPFGFKFKSYMMKRYLEEDIFFMKGIIILKKIFK